MPRKPARQSRSRSRRRNPLRSWLVGGLWLVLVAAGGYVAWLDYQVRSQFEGKRWSVPATVYARPLELYPGLALSRDGLLAELDAAGYRPAAGGQRPGTWAQDGDRLRLTTRAFGYWDGREPARTLALRFADGRLQSLRDPDSGEPVDLARLDPATIGAIAPTRREDRLLVQLDDVPVSLIGALLAVEDRRFHRHFGVSPSGIARAAMANIRAGRIVQGGSTLTQQLVKNLFLTGEQTFTRKVNEAIMAVLLELRYDKRDILETYLNEVFIAQDGDRSVHGFGLAAQYFFGEPLDALRIDQQALLVAMIKGPSYYNPRRNPERARQRRNLVLGVMADTGVIEADVARTARQRPLDVLEQRRQPRHDYPAFMDLVQRHLQRDYRREDLQSEGLRVFSTLAPTVQHAAEEAVTHRLDRSGDALEAAVVMLDLDAGEVSALVGGRDPGFAGFNRALDARRPIGSLIKPAVYLAALERPAAWGLGSVLDDTPLRIEDERGNEWAPRNFDGEFRGDVLLVDALAHSYNIPAVRLGQEIGVNAVTSLVRRLGQNAPRRAYPSYMLGTAELSPMEVAGMYQVFANQGFSTPLRSVRAVTDAAGEPLRRYRLSTERVVDPEPMYLLNHALGEVMREGTGRNARATLPAGMTVAGKTGTTNDYRDSWFAGFSGDTLGVVWLGRDDNAGIGLTGSSGALGIWADALSATAVRGFQPTRPEGVKPLWIDQDTGARSHQSCSGSRELPYVVDHAPEEWTECGRRSGDDNGGGGGLLQRWFGD